MPDKGTRTAIFKLRVITERCVDMQKDVNTCFMGYAKAFDQVQHEPDGLPLAIAFTFIWKTSNLLASKNLSCSESSAHSFKESFHSPLPMIYASILMA